jgi:streptomycin 6-kinase
MAGRIGIPEAFAAGVIQEHGPEGRDWLAALPAKFEHYCELWGLQAQGEPWHGYLGLVFPVGRGSERAALKLTWLDEETRDEAAALRLWNGRGAVRLLQSEPGVLLLERLQAERSLLAEPLDLALDVAASLLGRLAIPAPPEFLDMGEYARELFQLAEARWAALGEPFPRQWLKPPPQPGQSCLVNQDLHYANVLKAEREDWLMIDPKPLRGEPEFGLAPLLWNRSLEGDLGERFERLVARARLDRERALEWALFRVLEYWLWALNLGLTEDPARCQRLVRALGGLSETWQSGGRA